MAKKSFKDIYQSALANADVTVENPAEEITDDQLEAPMTAQDWIDSGADVSNVPPGTGLMNTPIAQPEFSYSKPDGATVLHNQGAYITYGQVPIFGQSSDYGAQGVPADTIDLVVGRAAGNRGGEGPASGEIGGNNPATDAARIYITRLGDADRDFGLVSKDEQAQSTAQSYIGVKADIVRMVGRDGIKLVTGRMDGLRAGPNGEPNSKGGKSKRAGPIEFVVGNNYDKVQPIVLAHNTAEAFEELNKIIGHIWSAVFNLTLAQTGFTSVSSVTPLPWIAAAGTPTINMHMNYVLNPLYHARTNQQLWLNTYVRAGCKKYIGSTNVRSN